MKALRKNMTKGNLKWELYDLATDPGEKSDIAAKHPEIIEKVNQIVAREHTQSEIQAWKFKALGE